MGNTPEITYRDAIPTNLKIGSPIPKFEDHYLSSTVEKIHIQDSSDNSRISPHKRLEPLK